ncbi:MAG: DUF5686 family protein [Flavobacterium sp.]|nr:DUF5686 family protein [Flavobacterium sp.]
MKQLLALIFFFTVAAQAQFAVKGIVKNAKTGEALPFASITSGNDGATITDVDGKFVLQTFSKITNISISYVGFHAVKLDIIPAEKYYVVDLVPIIENLNAVFVDNPADHIIKLVIREKEHNNPQKKLSSFQFKSYNKLIITANPDAIESRIDSVFTEKNGKRKFSKIDSSAYKFSKIVSKRHLFQTEKVSQFQFSDGHLKENILGTKMAGFSQPVYEIIAFNLQSFSIYDQSYELFETNYVSPITLEAFAHYKFKLLDTVSIQNRKIYLVYFRPKRKKKSTGLEGLLYIDAKNYALAKAVMRIRGVLDISAIHEFKYLESEKIWFPSNKEFKIVKGKNDEDIKILGETLKFDGDKNDSDPKRPKQASDFTYLLSKSYNFDAEYNIPLKIRNSSIAIEIKDEAIKKEEDFWEKYRTDSIDVRSPQTYFALDSIAKKRRIEQKLRIGRKIINGYLPLGPLDLDLRYLLSYNNYEGFRVGLGGITNEKFSRKYKIEGYSAYGTKDGAFKYNLGGAARIGKFSNTWMGASYTDDVREIASTSFAIDKRVFKIYDPRPINVSTFYNYWNYRAYIETRIIPKTESIWQLVYSKVNPEFEYTYNLNGKAYHEFTMTTAMVSLQWNPFSSYMQTPTGRLEIEKRFPKFTFQFTQALPHVLDNDFEFTKIDFRAEYEKKYLNGQRSALLIEAGYANGDVPITHLYNTSPNNLTKEKIIQRITLSGKNSFETMFFNEFFSSQYIKLQLKHGFKRVSIFNKVKPSLVLVTRMAWGDMEHPENHIGINYKTLENGFFESGIELNQIFKGLGLTGFYRYGPNQLPRFEDNIAVKLSFVLDLGL